jgi:DNA mismatch endonuclease (patch repair protein)
MPDIFSVSKRSDVMSKIRSRHNKRTEIALVQMMRLSGISGWRRHLRITGTPDFCFPRQGVVVFVDGCFWHGCPRCYTRPKTNTKFWDAKVATNKRRDQRVNRELKAGGWKVIRIWEHSLAKQPFRCIKRIQNALRETKGQRTKQRS